MRFIIGVCLAIFGAVISNVRIELAGSSSPFRFCDRQTQVATTLQKYSHMKNEKLPFEQRIPYSLGPSNHPARSINGHPGRMSFVFRYPKQRIWLAGLAMFTISQFFNFFAVGFAPQGNPLALSYHACARHVPARTRTERPNELSAHTHTSTQ